MSTIIHQTDEQRYEALVGDEVVGAVDYTRHGKTLTIKRTTTVNGMRGQGLASRLTRHVINDARTHGLILRLDCPFSKEFVARHSEYADVL